VWQQRVQRWADSGLTAKEFAAETGVNVHTLTHWKWRLSAAQGRGAATADRQPSPGFVEIAAPPVPSGARTTTSNARPQFELILPSGVEVRVPVDFDAVALHRLVTALEAAR
jgi:transposase